MPSVFGEVEFADVADALLKYYIRGKALAQTIQDKPLLSWLRSGQETFPGGQGQLSFPVQGAFISDAGDNLQAIGGVTQLSFKSGANIKRCEYDWEELHMGFVIPFTDLKKDGISVIGKEPREHSKADVVRLTAVLKNRLDDFTESNMRAVNKMLWDDGSLGAGYIMGLRGLFSPVADPATVTIGGLSAATYTYWRFRQKAGANKIATSPTAQTLTKTLRSEVRQLRRYGGKPAKIFAGSGAIEALEAEVFEKGVYTQDGFRNEGKNDIGMANIRMMGVGTFEYDPTMDDLGLSKHIYVLDGRRVKLWVMEDEDMRTEIPTRPHDYLIFLQSVFLTGALCATQPNAIGVYEVA